MATSPSHDRDQPRPVGLRSGRTPQRRTSTTGRCRPRPLRPRRRIPRQDICSFDENVISVPSIKNRRLTIDLQTSTHRPSESSSTRPSAGLHSRHASSEPARPSTNSIHPSRGCRTLSSNVSPKRRFTPMSQRPSSKYVSQRSSETPVEPANQSPMSRGSGPGTNHRSSVAVEDRGSASGDAVGGLANPRLSSTSNGTN